MKLKRTYWAKRNYFANKSIEGVDWKAFEKAALKTSGHHRRWLTNHFSHTSATSKIIHRLKWKERTQSAHFAKQKTKIQTTLSHLEY